MSSGAPSHLSLPARRLFDGILELYALEGHDRALLVKALEAWDRAEQARVLVTEEGLVILSRLGERKPHPAVAIERDSRAAYMAGMRQLGLDFEPVRNHDRTAKARDARWAK